MTYTIQNIKPKMNGIYLDAITIKKFFGKHKRLICTINKTPIHCAIMHNVGVGHFIMLSAATLKKIQQKIGDTVTATFTADTSAVQFKENVVLNEVLASDAAANKIYQQLTDGNKRGIISLIELLKTEAKQIERALLIAEKMKKGIIQPRLLLK